MCQLLYKTYLPSLSSTFPLFNPKKKKEERKTKSFDKHTKLDETTSTISF